MGIMIKDSDLHLLRKHSPEFASLLRLPIVDPIVRNQLQQRAHAFRTQSTALSLELHDELSFDLGARSVTDSCIMSMVAKSNHPLHEYVEKKLGIDKLKKDEMSAAFGCFKRFDLAASRKLRAPVFKYHEFVLVTLKRQNRDFGMYLIGDKGFRKLFYTNRPSPRIRYKMSLWDLIGDPSARHYGLHSHVPIFSRGGWRAARYSNEILLPNSFVVGDDIFQGGRTLVGKLDAISEKSFVSARYLGLALYETPLNNFPRRHRAVFRDVLVDDQTPTSDLFPNGSPTGSSVCAAGCWATLVAGAAITGKTFLGCVASPLGLIPLLCEIGATAVGVASLATVYACIRLCDALTVPSQAPGPPVASNEGDGNGDGDVDDDGDDDDDGDGDDDDGDGDYDDGDSDDEGGGGGGGTRDPFIGGHGHGSLVQEATKDPWDWT
jgi:hypothetical protein